MLSQQIESSKDKQKESANKIKTKLMLDLNQSNWNIHRKKGQLQGIEGVNSAKNTNLTPRMTVFDFSINNISETTGF